MNLMYCGDEGTIDGIMISLLSILKHIKTPLYVYILTMDFQNHKSLSKKTINYLDNLVKRTNKESFVKRFDMEKKYTSCIPKANIDTRFTPYCMLRLYADLLDELPSKILYLDYDVVCQKDFSKLYNIDNKDYELVGVLDYYGSHFFRKKFYQKDYLNSGVLLLNLDLIKKTGLFQKARKMCQEKKMLMPDQSALNKLCQRKLIVSRIYNEQKKLTDKTVFRHFSTTFKFFPKFRTQTIKPWHVDKMHNVLKIYAFDDIIEKYKIEMRSLNNE